MIRKITIRDKEVTYDEGEKNVKYGVRHLKETLSRDESKVFFKQASLKGSAQFEDKDRRQFTLMYKAGTYFLIARK